MCIGGLVERAITADRLTVHLEDLVALHGPPKVVRSDTGPESISQAMADWAGTRTGLSYIPPGSPWRGSYVESFESGRAHALQGPCHARACSAEG